jgi:radical SAM superfamily enzyme YgiQ (UPF0313 family)
MMKLIIFNPPRYRNGRHHKFNNALLWLASYLYQRGVSVRIVPLNGEKFEEEVRDEIARTKPEFAAVSCKWWDTLYSSSTIASLIKSLDPNIITIAGGQTATFFSRDLVEHTDFDVVIRGDGEEPLYQLVTGGTPANCVFKGQDQLLPMRKRNDQYIQTEDSLGDIFLIENLEEILSDLGVLNSYIWTGKGCVETCLYCAGNSWNNVQSFGRFSQIYRPIELVVREISILQKYPGVGRVTFDFDPVRGHVEENYYLDLFSALEKGKYNCFFYSWSLPSKKIIDGLAKTFNFVELGIDVQTGSDRLRKQLADLRYLKPYFSNHSLEEILTYVQHYDNFMVELSSLMGLPLETDEDVEEFKRFSDYFYDKFDNMRYPYSSPMNVEPGSLLMRSPDRYNMVLFRKTFSDFMEYTRECFENNINCYRPARYGTGVFHPLGVCSEADYENGNIFSVYESWKLIQAYVNQRSSEKALMRAKKYKKYGLSKAGITGGVNLKTQAHLEVE